MLCIFCTSVDDSSGSVDLEGLGKGGVFERRGICGEGDCTDDVGEGVLE